jgi:hypothetical protein
MPTEQKAFADVLAKDLAGEIAAGLATEITDGFNQAFAGALRVAIGRGLNAVEVETGDVAPSVVRIFADALRAEADRLEAGHLIKFDTEFVRDVIAVAIKRRFQ